MYGVCMHEEQKFEHTKYEIIIQMKIHTKTLAMIIVRSKEPC